MKISAYVILDYEFVTDFIDVRACSFDLCGTHPTEY